MDAWRIHYDMEQETIIYFYSVSEQQKAAGRMAAAKRCWFQNVSLGIRYLGGRQDEFGVAGCFVPPFYCRNKPWKPQVLSQTMEEVLHHAEGLTDTFLHPQIAAMLTKDYGKQWVPRRNTVQKLVKCMMEQGASDAISRNGEAVVLLGEITNMCWQMEMTRELLLPYLPKINRLLIFYEEAAETDIWTELSSHLDDYYYEYGLVPQLESYAETADGFRCGKSKCSGVIFDYCEDFRYPKMVPDSTAVYIDMVSQESKERLLARRSLQIPYVSPLKYLDTMVKNSYDGLVN